MISETSNKRNTHFDFVYKIFFFNLGLVIGCLPIYGLRQSTLKCFYNSTCLEGMADFMGASIVFNPLDMSINSRFIPVSSVSIGTLIDEMFIETWQIAHNYSAYFISCAPSSCRYSDGERNTFIYMLTTSLGLYGGLTVGVKVFVWHLLSIYWKVRPRLFNRSHRVTFISLS